MLDIAQQQDRANEITLAVMQRRNGHADRRLSAPTRDEIAFAARALLSRRLGFLNQLDEPRLTFKELSTNSCIAWRCRRDFREHFGSFVKER